MTSISPPTTTHSFSSATTATHNRISYYEPIDAETPAEERFVNPTSGRKLRNTSFYGRHSNDWLFGSVEVKKSIRNFFSRKHRKPAY